jgi:hypothetical protein
VLQSFILVLNGYILCHVFDENLGHLYICSSALLLLLLLLLFSLALQPSVGYALLVTQGFSITHNNAPQSVGLLLDE